MTVEYKLLTATLRGFPTKTTPIFLDLDSKVELSFFMSSGKTMTEDYYVVLVDCNDKEHTIHLENGKAILPQWLIKQQVLQLNVILVENYKPIKRWICQPLHLNNLSEANKTVFELYPEYTIIPERLQTLENDLNNELIKNAELQANAQTQTVQIIELERKFNEAIAAINILSERIELLENY